MRAYHQSRYLGKPFVYPPESGIGHHIEQGGEWDWFLPIVLRALVKEREPTICEVGSNIGASLMQVLGAKPRARVLAFEPSDFFRSYLLRNIGFAGTSGRVQVYPYLVGREAGAKKLYRDATSASAMEKVLSYREHGQEQDEQMARMVTLDAVLAGERVHFIKVDTDGFEFEVLRGAVNTLKESRPCLHLEFATYLIPEPLQNLAWLQGLGYKRLLCLTPAGEPIGVTEDPSEAVKWAEDNSHCDIVACVEGSKAEARLLSPKLLLSLKLHGKKERLKYARWRAPRLSWEAPHLSRKARRLSRKARRLSRKAYRLSRKATRRLSHRAAYRLIAKLREARRP